MKKIPVTDLRAYVRRYLVVFLSLIFLTFLVVAVSMAHMNATVAVLLLLSIAFVKAGLVACYFMHLISEKSVIYGLLILMAVVLAALLLLPLLELLNSPGTF